jgi:hypothetical protein
LVPYTRAAAVVALAVLGVSACSLTSSEDSGVLLQDDFSDSESGWPTRSDREADLEYALGGYRILVKDPRTAQTSSFDLGTEVDALGLEAFVVQEAGSHILDGYGIGCYRPDDTGYAFAISADGHYAIFTTTADRFGDRYLAEGDAPEVIRGFGAINRMEATCVAGELEKAELSFTVNGKEVAQAADVAGKGGEFAGVDLSVFAGAPEAAVRFDDVVAWNLSEPKPESTARPPQATAVVYSDDFSSDSCALPVHSDDTVNLRCVAGGYGIEVRSASFQESTLAFAPGGRAVAVKADSAAQALELTADEAHGIGCWTARDRGYAFTLSQQGAFGIYELTMGNLVPLAEGVDQQLFRDALPRGQDQMLAECVAGDGGTSLVLSVGGRPIASARDPDGRDDFEQFGLVVRNGEARSIEVVFDNVRVERMTPTEAAAVAQRAEARAGGAGATPP